MTASRDIKINLKPNSFNPSYFVGSIFYIFGGVRLTLIAFALKPLFLLMKKKVLIGIHPVLDIIVFRRVHVHNLSVFLDPEPLLVFCLASVARNCLLEN